MEERYRHIIEQSAERIIAPALVEFVKWILRSAGEHGMHNCPGARGICKMDLKIRRRARDPADLFSCPGRMAHVSGGKDPGRGTEA